MSINNINKAFYDKGWYPQEDPIIVWYRNNNGVCTTCGIDLKEMPPEFNIYPHFTGACKQENAK
jgi:hypothetical protein